MKELDETIIFELTGFSDPADGTVDSTRNSSALTLGSDEGSLRLSWLLPGEFLDDARNIDDEKIPEGAGGTIGIQFRVSMDVESPPSAIGLTVRSGTAQEGEDYELTTVVPMIRHIGPSSGMEWYEGFRITIIADDVEEGDEYFEVVLDDTAGNQLAQPLRVTIAGTASLDPILGETGNFAIARAEALLENQPRLIPMLRDPDDRSGFELRATEGGVEAEGGFRAETAWGATTLSRSTDGGEHEHLLTTLGAHFRTSERLVLGGMLQFDRSEMKAGGRDATSGEIGGRGWMAGPYFAARDASRPLFFEGRLLYGRASNDIDDLVLVGAGAPLSTASVGWRRPASKERISSVTARC